jgi:hypothetical protein
LKKFLYIAFPTSLSFIVFIAALLISPAGTSHLFKQVFWSFVVAFILLIFIFIAYRNKNTNAAKEKNSIYIDALGLSFGFLIALIAFPLVLDVLFWDIFKEIAGAIFGAAVYFTFLTYIGLLLVRQVGKYFNKSK